MSISFLGKLTKSVEICVATIDTIAMKHAPPSEFALIERIRQKLGPDRADVRVGIGDDAAVVDGSALPLLLCSDAMVEGTHFRLEWSAPEALGHKALASCLSDIAAMNGEPLYALVSLALRPDLPKNFTERLYSGLSELAKRFDTQVVGGDLAASRQEVFIDVMLVGKTANPVTRAGARSGDLLLVSGHPGSAAAGLYILQSGRARDALTAPLLDAQLRPLPRFDVIRQLNIPGLMTAMIDISDGLASETHHLARQSNCGFVIDMSALPIHPAARQLAAAAGLNPYDWAWSGGEDYELLICVDRNLWHEHLRAHPETGALVTVIGEAVHRDHGVMVREKPDLPARPLTDTGWVHFK